MSAEAALTVDVIVLGGGMGGLTAASYVARQGQTVLLVEKAPELGGTAVLSSAVLWTAPTFQDWRDRCPGADARLGRVLVNGLPDVLEWLASLNVDVRPPVIQHGYAPSWPFDIIGYVHRAARIIEDAGGLVMRSTVTERLLTAGGRVTGAVLRDAEGTRVAVAATAVVLATGGFQGDAQLRATFIHPSAARMVVRANPFSVGDGLRLAMDAGGSVNDASSGFYGHLVCAPMDRFEGSDFNLLYQHYSYTCLLVNLDGQRFTDERVGDHVSAQALVGQREGRGLLVFDDRVYRTSVTAPNVDGLPAYDKLRLARERGASTATAQTPHELATIVERWGFRGDGVERSIEAFNAGTDVLPNSDLPLKVAQVPALTNPPFYAMEVQPAITFAHAGIRIDEHARVLGQDGRPVPGLYACGADIGGVYDRGYCGGLALGGVFGIVAARDIVRRQSP